MEIREHSAHFLKSKRATHQAKCRGLMNQTPTSKRRLPSFAKSVKIAKSHRHMKKIPAECCARHPAFMRRLERAQAIVNLDPSRRQESLTAQVRQMKRFPASYHFQHSHLLQITVQEFP